MTYHALPLQFADAQLATGVRVRYAEQGASADEPIILLHGYTDSSFSFSGVLPRLSAICHTYALDQRGHGDSDRPESGYELSHYADDVVAFMDAMGLPTATIVGHSFGSFVAQQVALAEPGRVARLVLIGSATTPRNENVLKLQQAVNKLEDPVPPEFAQEFQASTIYQPLPDEFMERVIAESLKLPARVWKAALAGMLAADLTGQLSQIKAPTLILWGDQDAIFPLGEQNSLAAALASATLKVYTETGHALHWERPEQFVRDLEEFLTGPVSSYF